MRDFIRFLYNSHFVILFLILEFISIFISIRNTDKTKIFISSANSVSGYFSKKINQVSNYFELKEQNITLRKENEKLRNMLNNIEKDDIKISQEFEETGVYYTSAEVIKNSVHFPHNILTINKGLNQGIKEDMAVISDAGVVGVVAKSGKQYASVISLLNIRLGISAKIQRTGYFGDLKWDGGDYQFVYLYDIPFYSSLYIGDEIVTSGFSSLFPEGIPIGTVYAFEKEKESSFYKIKVKLSQDFKKIDNVYVIDFKGREEIIQLQDSTIKQFQF